MTLFLDFAASLVLIIFWSFSFIGPLWGLIKQVLMQGAPLELWQDPTLISIAKVTVLQALTSTLFALGFGIPLGLLIGRSALNRALLMIPFTLPTLLVATTAIIVLGKDGLNIAYSLFAVIVAHTFINTPFVATQIAHARSQISQDEIQAARTLGATSRTIFRGLYWPSFKWTIGSVALQIYSMCLMSFSLVLILGGGPPVETLEVLTYSKIKSVPFDLQGAVAAGLLQSILCIFPWLILLRLRSKNPFAHNRITGISKPPSRLQSRLALIISAAFTFPFVWFLSTVHYEAFLKSPDFILNLLPPLITSLKIALGTSGLALFVTLQALFLMRKDRPRFNRFLEILQLLPNGFSILVLGIGFWLAFQEWIDPFEGSLTAIIALQSLCFCPFTFRTLWPHSLSFQKTTYEAAITLGASPVRAFFLIEWPKWKAPVLETFALLFAFSLGEFAVVSLFYSENLIPLPLVISRLLGQYQFEEAQFLSAFLFLMVSITLLVSWFIQYRDSLRIRSKC